jgi:hypothetical protein
LEVVLAANTGFELDDTRREGPLVILAEWRNPVEAEDLERGPGGEEFLRRFQRGLVVGGLTQAARDAKMLTERVMPTI